MRNDRRLVLLTLLPLLAVGVGRADAFAQAVTPEDLVRADAFRGNWLTYGRTYNSQRFSPLAQITRATVKDLRPVWGASLGTTDGQEATPLVHGGRIYVTSAWAHLYVFNARTGRPLWRYIPEYPEGLATVLCCGANNRGVALLGGRVFLTTLDNKLVALDAGTGAEVWKQTFADWQDGFTATGAPLAVRQHIIVGVAGGEYGVRGFLKSFNAETGALEWTTYTVPGPGEPGNETWSGDAWQRGGAPTWVTGSYDPELNLVYWGTGNPGPWAPDAHPGDNLYTNCVLAINPDDGKIKWYFQYTPNDGWDYDGVNTPVLVDVPLQGKPVKALIQPNRNGFFYMLNRENGKFIYAMPMIDGINWTTGIDPVTGRPTPNPEKVVKTGGPTVEDIVPGLEGGVNWSPLAYNPHTRLAYVTVNDWSMSLKAEPVEYKRGQWYTGETYQMYQTEKPTGHLKAIDVVNRRIVWDWPSPLHLFAGALATAGGLVFTGDAYGYFRAFDDRTGTPLWKFQTGSAINAPAVSYEIDGVQYVAVLSGMGGDLGYYLAGQKSGMLWAFALRNLSVTEDESGGFPQTNENLKRKP